MKRNLLWAIFITGIFWGESVVAQLSITFPLERSIFQRNQNNSALISIAGNYTVEADKIEVRFTPVQGGQQSGWITIQENPMGGYYSGSASWTGGWYQLNVRATNNGVVSATASLGKVGIGEVFLIGGQSNASGYTGRGAPAAIDDRVNVVNDGSTNYPVVDLDYPRFAHLEADTKIAPRGGSAWAYGRLGDLLATRLNVPVLFYNVGWDGSAARNWRESLNGGTAYSVYVEDVPFNPSGTPYGALRDVLQNYVAITGIRGVLWIQGEADNDVGTNPESYGADINRVIRQSRIDTKKKELSWVVARTTYIGRVGTNPDLIREQNQIINEDPNVFAGPETDKIQIPRPGDGYHFAGAGLAEVGAAWSNSLSDSYFAQSTPYPAKAMPNVAVACGSENNLTLSVEGNYSKFSWNNGTNSRSVSVGAGAYQASMTDPDGNKIYTPFIGVPQDLSGSAPSISAEGSTTFCQGGRTTLISSAGENSVWSNGQTGERITVSQPGNYTVSTQNIFGCRSTSQAIVIRQFDTPPPARPVISSSGPTSFCQNDEVTLTTNSDLKSIWSTGEINKSIMVDKEGEFTVQSEDANGCLSVPSSPVRISVRPLPTKPIIRTSSTPSICQGSAVRLTSSYTQGNTWSTSATTSSINVATSGSYTVKVRDGNGCENTSDPIVVRVNPLPRAPVITATRPTTFCDGDFTVLASNDQNRYEWSNGAMTQEVRIINPGAYSVKAVNIFGCRSAESSPIQVRVNPLPPRPAVTASGPTTFCADKEVSLSSSNAEATEFLWSNNLSSREITVNQAGQYSVRTRNSFDCLSNSSAPVEVQTLALPATPVVEANGPTTVCEGERVTLAAQGSAPFKWNNGANSPNIQVSNDDDFFVQSLGSNGCISLRSNVVTIETRPVPGIPVIEKAGAYTIIANSHSSALFNWEADGAAIPDSLAEIKVRDGGIFRAQAYIRYGNELTCASEFSANLNFEIDSTAGDLVVYPNPVTDGKVNLETYNDYSNTTIEIYSVRGDLMKTVRNFSLVRKNSIRLLNFPAGTYFIKVIAGRFVESKKIILMN